MSKDFGDFDGEMGTLPLEMGKHLFPLSWFSLVAQTTF